jgi:hypothetical protein
VGFVQNAPMKTPVFSFESAVRSMSLFRVAAAT